MITKTPEVGQVVYKSRFSSQEIEAIKAPYDTFINSLTGV